MPDTPDTNPSPANLAARQIMRSAVLTDFDTNINTAGGLNAFLFTAPRSELDRLLHRVETAREGAEALPAEGAAAHINMQRVYEAGMLLNEEMHAREMVSGPARNEHGELAYDLDDDVHRLTQADLSRRLAFHELKLMDPTYEQGVGFDHMQAATAYRSHLIAQQVDAYDRGLPVYESAETQFLLGAELHDRATRALLRAEEVGEEPMSTHEVADLVAEHPEYLRDAIDQHRQFRHDVAIDQGEGVYPVDLPEDMEPAWDIAAASVDAGINQAYDREPQIGAEPHRAPEAASYDPSRFVGMTGRQIGEEYVVGDIGHDELSDGISDEQLDQIIEWVDAQMESEARSVDEERFYPHEDLSNFAYEETYVRHHQDELGVRGLNAEQLAQRFYTHGVDDEALPFLTKPVRQSVSAHAAAAAETHQLEADATADPAAAADHRRISDRWTEVTAHVEEFNATEQERRIEQEQLADAAAEAALDHHEGPELDEEQLDQREEVDAAQNRDVAAFEPRFVQHLAEPEAFSLPPLETSMADVNEALAALSGQPVAAPLTPARDAYLNARGEAAVLGSALASPQIKAALQLDQLQQNQKRIEQTLPQGYDPANRPGVMRWRARAEWDRQQPLADALAANTAKQDQIREKLGPNSDKLVVDARDLVGSQNELLANTAQLQRDAIDEDIAREPEWLTNTLGPRPEAAAGRWQAIAGDLAANRLRFGVSDDADPGIRPDQTMLADKVSAFRAEVGLTQGLAPKADVGMGM